MFLGTLPVLFTKLPSLASPEQETIARRLTILCNCCVKEATARSPLQKDCTFLHFILYLGAVGALAPFCSIEVNTHV